MTSSATISNEPACSRDQRVEEVDLLVVGGGKAGKSLAMLRAKAGDKVIMVERDKVGGTCINVACIPTKTLISAARVLHEVQGSGAYGVTLPEQDGGTDALTQARIDLASFRARKEAVVGGHHAPHDGLLAGAQGGQVDAGPLQGASAAVAAGQGDAVGARALDLAQDAGG